MKRQILCKAVVNEIGGMMTSSRASVAKRQQANQAEIGRAERAWSARAARWSPSCGGKITAEKNAYNAALAEYKVNHAQFSGKKTALLDMLQRAEARRGARQERARRSRTRGPRSRCSAA
jgi:hypothetical protein